MDARTTQGQKINLDEFFQPISPHDPQQSEKGRLVDDSLPKSGGGSLFSDRKTKNSIDDGRSTKSGAGGSTGGRSWWRRWLGGSESARGTSVDGKGDTRHSTAQPSRLRSMSTPSREGRSRSRTRGSPSDGSSCNRKSSRRLSILRRFRRNSKHRPRPDSRSFELEEQTTTYVPYSPRPGEGTLPDPGPLEAGVVSVDGSPANTGQISGVIGDQPPLYAYHNPDYSDLGMSQQPLPSGPSIDDLGRSRKSTILTGVGIVAATRLARSVLPWWMRAGAYALGTSVAAAGVLVDGRTGQSLTGEQGINDAGRDSLAAIGRSAGVLGATYLAGRYLPSMSPWMTGLTSIAASAIASEL